MEKIEFGLAGFIPWQLEVDGHPELSNFSLNILFGSQAMIDGVHTIGTALYEPDFSSYCDDGEKRSLVYYNIYSNDWSVRIDYYPERKIYEGKKYHLDKAVLEAGGPEWKIFFTHLTMIGLSKGERCKFEKV